MSSATYFRMRCRCCGKFLRAPTQDAAVRKFAKHASSCKAVKARLAATKARGDEAELERFVRDAIAAEKVHEAKRKGRADA